MNRSEDSPFVPFRDLLRLIYNLGARPKEICETRVAYVNFERRQITLSNHKNAARSSRFKPRIIHLDDESLEILKKHSAGKRPNDVFFRTTKHEPWTTQVVDKRFQVVRRLAGVRDHLTPYSFRHLWITEMLQHASIHQVAQLAGTSVQMIEATYYHFLPHAAEQAIQSLATQRQARASR